MGGKREVRNKVKQRKQRGRRWEAEEEAAWQGWRGRENVRKGEAEEEAHGRSGMLRTLDFLIWAAKSLQRKLCYLLQNRCYELNVHVPLQFTCCNPKSLCAGVWRWGLRELTRAWSWNPHNVDKALRRENGEISPLLFLPSGSLPCEDITKTRALIRN